MSLASKLCNGKRPYHMVIEDRMVWSLFAASPPLCHTTQMCWPDRISHSSICTYESLRECEQFPCHTRRPYIRWCRTIAWHDYGRPNCRSHPVLPGLWFLLNCHYRSYRRNAISSALRDASQDLHRDAGCALYWTCSHDVLCHGLRSLYPIKIRLNTIHPMLRCTKIIIKNRLPLSHNPTSIALFTYLTGYAGN